MGDGEGVVEGRARGRGRRSGPPRPRSCAGCRAAGRSRRPRRRRCRRGGASSAGPGSPARSARGSASRPCAPRRRSRRRPCPRRWAARRAAGRGARASSARRSRLLADWVLRHLTSRVPRLLRAGARRVDESANYRDGESSTRVRVSRNSGAEARLRPRTSARSRRSGSTPISSAVTGASERLRIVRLGGRLDRGEGAGRRRMVLAVDPQHRLALEDHVELDLAALGLVVLGDLPAGADLDQVEAEGRGAERLARQPPGRVARALHRLELVAVLDRVAVGHRIPRGGCQLSRQKKLIC